MRTLILAALVLVLMPGCMTHRFLGRNAVKQSATLTNLVEQQVLDNVAEFSRNPDALPHFAVIGDGTTQSQDSGYMQPTFMWNATTFTGANLPLNASRQLMENWKLQPVMSAGRVRRMRCAFQLLFYRPTFHIEENSVCMDRGCIPCIDELIKVGLLKTSVTAKEELGPNSVCWQLKSGKEAALFLYELENELDCRIPTDWFCVGRHRDVPHDACVSGQYCGTHVWVPSHGRDAFSRFTLSILALAATDPPPKDQTINLKHSLAEGNKLELLSKLRANKGQLNPEIQTLIDNTSLSPMALFELRAKLTAMRDADPAAAGAQQAQRAIDAINDYFAPPAQTIPDVFDRPGSMPFSRGGGIEFTPPVPGQ